MSTIQGTKYAVALQGVPGSAIQSPYAAPDIAEPFKPINTILENKTLYPWGNAYTWDFMPWNWGKSDREPDGPTVQTPTEQSEPVSSNIIMYAAVLIGALVLLKRGDK